MITKKMITIIAGIAVGLVVVGGTVGGLAGAGVFSSNTTSTQKNGGGSEKEEKNNNLLQAKVAIYNAFSKYAEGEIKNNQINIEDVTDNTIDSKITKLKNGINDEFYKLHLDHVLKEVKDVKELATEKLQSIKTMLKEYAHASLK